MAYLRCTPPAPLDRLVDHLWVFEQHEVGADAGVLFADGCTDLMFHLTGTILLRGSDGTTRWSGGWVSGHRTRPIRIELLARRFTMVGARLRPTGLGALLHAPANEAHDQVLELRQFWRGFAAETAERLVAAEGPAARLQVLATAMQRQVAERHQPPASLAATIESLLHRPASRRIDQVRQELGISHKHLTRLFRLHVGLAPKTFQRVSRFRQLLHTIDRTPTGRDPRRPDRAQLDWAHLALAHGFSDQAHLTRDFHAFTGMPPTRYQAPPMAAPDYMPWAPPSPDGAQRQRPLH